MSKHVPLPPVASARQLTDRWAARDAQYASRKIHSIRTPLSLDEQNAVIRWRRAEAEGLPPRDSSVALATLAIWAPPAMLP